MAGFIVLEDGRAYAASNSGTDAAIRAIAARVPDHDFRDWLLQQQSSAVGASLTSVDLREVAPRYRPTFYRAARDAYACVKSEGGFEDLGDDPRWFDSWLGALGDLIEMIDRWEIGEPPEQFNPHMLKVLDPTGHRSGPGWT